MRADVAQLVEHSLGKGEVTSSILVISSRNAEIRDQGSEIRTGRNEGIESASICENKLISELWSLNAAFTGGSNSVVESQPSKLLVAGSNPVSRSKDSF